VQALTWSPESGTMAVICPVIGPVNVRSCVQFPCGMTGDGDASGGGLFWVQAVKTMRATMPAARSM
jgi:hypothetical protein